MEVLGIDEVEKKIDVLAYNHQLFDNMALFVDAVWEINVSQYSVYVLHDKITPALNKRKVSMDEILAYITEGCHSKYLDRLNETLSEYFLRTLKETVKIEVKALINYSYHSLRICYTPVLNDFGDTEVVYVTVQDIQDIVDEHETKINGQQELDRYLTSMSCGVIHYTKNTNRIIYANDTALDILGYRSIEEMQNAGFDGVVSTVNPEDSVKIKELIKGLVSEEKVVECEYRVKHKDGREIFCMGKIRVINIEGEEPIIQRSMIDVTALRKSSELYKRVADTLTIANMGIWYFILDDGKPRFYVDDTVERLIGAKKGSTPEENYEIWYNTLSDDVKLMVDNTVEKAKGGIASEITYPYNHPTKGTIVIRCGCVLDKNYKENGICIRGYHQDISKYNNKLLEQIEVANVVNKHFAIVGALDFKKKTLKIISDSTGHLTHVVDVVRPIDSDYELFKDKFTDESRELYEKNMVPGEISKGIKENQHYSIVFEIKNDAKYRLKFEASGYDTEGNVERCVYFAERIEEK